MSVLPEKQRKFLKRSIIAVILLVVLLPFLWWQSTGLAVTPLSVESERLPASFHGFRILQVSDLHNNAYGERQSELLRMTREAAPDLIAITGDFLDYTEIGNAMDFARGAVKIAPTFFVPGNHETYHPEAYARLRKELLEAGVQVLEDEAVELWRGGEQVRLVGMRDPAFAEQEGESEPTAHFAASLAALRSQEEEYTILLSHRPELVETYAAQGLDLALTGHTHGGLVRLPFVGAIAALDQGFSAYTAGVQKVGPTSLVVSRGAGNGAVSFFRLGNRPELVLVTLLSRHTAPVRFTAVAD